MPASTKQPEKRLSHRIEKEKTKNKPEVKQPDCVPAGFGSLLMLTCGAHCPGLAANNPGLKAVVTGLVGLPTSMLLITITGAELFTGCAPCTLTYDTAVSLCGSNRP